MVLRQSENSRMAASEPGETICLKDLGKTNVHDMARMTEAIESARKEALFLTQIQKRNTRHADETSSPKMSRIRVKNRGSRPDSEETDVRVVQEFASIHVTITNPSPAAAHRRYCEARRLIFVRAR